ncbi:MAG: methyltransferase domain-containing protein [Dehalococcoidia bacterium]|nr:methyltransferase domain-containing protein [Dehalococcoidia bacterium]
MMDRGLPALGCPLHPDRHLALAGDALACPECRTEYAVNDGIPILLAGPAHDTHDELDHHKLGQASYFDRAAGIEFEINRPHDTPALYRWLMEEKLRQSVDRLPPLAGKTVLVACCGSGMEAEFLARRGARVLAFDISEGAVRRARTRQERFGFSAALFVADVERIPLAAGAVDIAYVHDGLHHLEQPLAGVAELARVARLAVSINEPARAAGTRLAAALGLAAHREPAGNVVARLEPEGLAFELSSLGFDPSWRRRLMYYKHEPGSLMGLLSRPGALDVYWGFDRIANALAGRWGNKLQMTAIKRRSNISSTM